MTAAFHVRPKGHKTNDVPGETRLAWPLTPGTTKSVTSDLAWDLAPLPGTTPAAADLVHLAAGAYMADRNTRRGKRFSRDIALRVAVHDPDLWTADILADTEDLLGWLTGDTWTLTTSQAPDLDTADALDQEPTNEPVSLLSGGLDSYLGAIHLRHQGRHPLFLGHRDTSTAVRSAQDRVNAWLAKSYNPVPSYTKIALTQTSKRTERSSRSRSLMFLSLGVAAAVSNNSSELVVPENGYTGINLPLRPNRGGALSTRSTHPETFRRVTALLDALSIDVTITNPFAWHTKGEAMALVRDSNPPDGWLDTAAATVSCSKFGGNWFNGSPNLNCGLCVPCMVRRTTFIAADLPDTTRYLCTELTGADLQGLIDRQRGDIEAVRYAIETGADPDAIDSGTWPPNYDLDQVENLVQRGLNELALLDLP